MENNSCWLNKTNKCSYLSAKVKITNRKKNYKSREMKVHVSNNISNKINALKAKNKFRLYYNILSIY